MLGSKVQTSIKYVVIWIYEQKSHSAVYLHLDVDAEFSFNF